MGSTQVKTLTQLSIMLLAPPDDGTNNGSDKTPEHKKYEDPLSESSGYISVFSGPSLFTFPLSSILLVLFDNKRFAASGINMRYKADGTVCILEAAKMERESNDKSRATLKRVENDIERGSREPERHQKTLCWGLGQQWSEFAEQRDNQA